MLPILTFFCPRPFLEQFFAADDFFFSANDFLGTRLSYSIEISCAARLPTL
jgi:hypothetical protein